MRHWDLLCHLEKEKKSRMPFILNALKKKFVHCFPAGNCSIIKYIRIPAGFQSDNWKTHLAGLPVQYTVHPRKRQKKKKNHTTFLCQTLPATHAPKLKTTSRENENKSSAPYGF